MQELQELKDKVAIITGGGYGIGKQIALAYGRAGMCVVIAARTQGPLEETCAEVQAAGARAMWLKTDVSKEADCARMIGETVKAFGRVDVLVNNAGIAGPTKLTPDMTLAEWQEVLDINITGAWLAPRALQFP
jgi:NAD(P)-dependent dehydrogenase (short-subunit alcohol dehydrogenase family)